MKTVKTVVKVKVALPTDMVSRTDEEGMAYMRYAGNGKEYPIGLVADVLPSHETLVWAEVEMPWLCAVLRDVA